jgi:DNA-directed RNA polymerase subunit RPC12/RpoP
MDNWKTILTFTHPHEAHIAKGYLESEGFETIIQDEITAQVNNFYSSAIGGVKILINETDYEKGIKILQKGGYINEQENKVTETIETHFINSINEKNKCPYCDSQNFSKAKKLSLLSLIGVLFFSGFFPIFKGYYHCFDCNKKWIFKIKK